MGFEGMGGCEVVRAQITNMSSLVSDDSAILPSTYGPGSTVSDRLSDRGHHARIAPSPGVDGFVGHHTQNQADGTLGAHPERDQSRLIIRAGSTVLETMLCID